MIKIIKANKPKVIFNLAAETHVDRSIDDPKTFIHTNINGVLILIRGVRYLKKSKNKK